MPTIHNETIDRPRDRERTIFNEGWRAGHREAIEQSERWRQCYESLRMILAQCGTNPDFERLDELMREWVAKA